MIAVIIQELRNEIADLWREAKELNLIFNSINNSLKENKEKR